MSALTAIYRPNKKPVEPEEMQKMLDCLKHRGTDDRGLHIENHVGLGHRMRWVTPESVYEKLPASGRKSSAVVTSDARIDNRDDLIEQLFSDSRRSAEITDSEIILRAYDKWGESCATKLLGDFVFVIWDAKLQKLFCARDSMGVKHFYYYYKPNALFAIASEVKALFCLPEIPKRLDETYIGDILILNHQDKEDTPYEGIKRLPANNALRIDENGLKVWQYWYPSSKSKNRFRTSDNYEEEFRATFAEAVRCRLRSINLTGSLLSGGLDSSSISCVASRHLEQAGRPPLETFSAVFPSIAKVDPRIDERHFIDSVVGHIRCNQNFVEADAFSPFQDMDKLHWHADHPIAAPNVFMDWALFKAAKQRNVGVLLSGFDGDSTVSYGYEAFRSLARQGRWWSLFRDAAALNKNMPGKHHSFKKLVWNQGFAEAAPEFVRQIWRVAHGRPRELEKVSTLPSSMKYHYESVNPDFPGKKDLEDRYFEALSKTHPETVGPSEAHWNALCSGIFAFALESFEKMAAGFEIDARFPFFDRRLIEFCISLPADQKVRKGWTRSIFRRAMNNILPSDVQWRTNKANIGLSYKINMIKYGSDQVEDTLFGSTGLLEKFISKETLAAAYQRYRADPLRHGQEALLLISTVYLSSWLRQSFESGPG
ncbi:MAG: asparagine synthase (glutamine-hydrolyzing) [Acidobacteria bacterium]|nr:asparagine synthase (glutamine-hydrolyzing) [Acidobacteriota bacterium]